MRRPKTISNTIYNRNITFENLIKFIERVRLDEDLVQNEFVAKIDITLVDGEEYSYKSCHEFFAETSKPEQETIRKSKIVGFTLDIYDHMSLRFGEYGSSIEYNSASSKGHALFASANDTLELRLKSLQTFFESKIGNGTLGIILILSIVLSIYLDNPFKSIVVIIVCYVFVKVFPPISPRVDIIMNNSTDSFIVRNSDSIIITLISIIISYAAGYYTNL
ncbi:hypothetical protein [Thalassotalea aquiviva]|uniref:hypothetical protein n=1 Tax=Thalassotalea aquiviva TaxID=3242415 RepID=UPI003529E1BB